MAKKKDDASAAKSEVLTYRGEGISPLSVMCDGEGFEVRGGGSRLHRRAAWRALVEMEKVIQIGSPNAGLYDILV